jgi:DNA-directed RNA polymerase specialized sigma24 family protein
LSGERRICPVALAALLTGEADAAEAVACAVLTALRPGCPIDPEPTEDVLRYLQAQVLVRSRRTRCRGAATTRTRRVRGGAQVSARTGTARPALPNGSDPTDFASLPVVRALQDLPRPGSEAVVLTHYLDLTEQEAALVAGSRQPSCAGSSVGPCARWTTGCSRHEQD